ncbi:MAG: AI-2E family transporter [Vicinamibacterales bacterium]
MDSSTDSSTTTAPIDVNARSVTLTLLAIAATMAVLHWAREVFIPIVVSILVSYALEPIVTGLMRIRLSRVVAAGIVMTALIGTSGLVGYTLADDAAAVVAELPDATTRIRQALRRGRAEPGAIQQVQQAAEELQRAANETSGPAPAPRGVQRVQIEQPAFDVRQYVSWGSASLVAFASQGVVVVFFVFFLLASGDLFKRKLVRIAGPSLEQKKITVQILNEINSQIARFLLVRVVTSLVVGVGTWLAFRWVGLEQAGVWGVAAAVFNSIPYFGPIIVATGTFIVAFLQFETIGMGAYVAGISLAITAMEGWLLTPWLASRTARTNEVAVFIGLMFWSFVWGLWGTLLAVPMLVAAKAFCDRIEDLKPIGELLGE